MPRISRTLILALAPFAVVDALRARPVGGLHAAAVHGGRAAATRLQTAPTATTATCKLHHAEAGSMLPSSELPLVILHGLFGAGANFQSWAKGLGDQDKSSRRIVLVDLRNHGNSEHVPSMSYREMAADVIALLDELGIAECALCGHSLGGKVAMATALLHPTRIERLLVLDMAPAIYDRETCAAWAEIHEVVRALRGLDVARLTSKKEAGALLEPSIPNGDMRAFALTNLVRAEGGGGFRWRFNLPTIEAYLPELAGWGDGLDELVYGRNTLFVGSNSRFLRSEHLPQMQQQFTCSSVTKVRDAGHWIHSDAPGPLQIVASNFLDVETDLCGACY